MNNKQFLHGSEQRSTLHKTDLLVYDEVIQQYDNELRFVIFMAEIYYLAEQWYFANPSVLGLHHPLTSENLYYGSVLVASENIFSRYITELTENELFWYNKKAKNASFSIIH